MSYLLDVSVLLALGYKRHVHHQWVRHWFSDVRPAKVATCAITELGFVRIASSRAGFVPDVKTALSDLRRLKAERVFTFLGDELAAASLPEWVIKSSQTTDGHLLQLAADHGARLVTLDRGIPGAEVISAPSDGWTVREPAPPYYAAA